MLRKLLIAALLVYAAGQIWTAITVVTYGDPAPIQKAAAIVVLSGPFSDDPGTKGETRIRVDKGVMLWKAGLAPSLVMSGGGSRALHDGPGDAFHMAQYAVSLGVPTDVITIEPASFSTLQNAWLTAELPDIDKTAPVLVVTQRYHLSRAVFSFWWAGFTDITPIAADRVPFYWTQTLEGVKWPLNIARAAGASVALRLGADEADVLPWLQ